MAAVGAGLALAFDPSGDPLTFEVEWLDGSPFEYETIPRNVAYYAQRTAHGSTLSRIVHSWVLARGARADSWHFFAEALQSDVGDIQGGTTREGIHLGAMAGTIDLVQRCYTGIEIRDDILWLNPLLPDELGFVRAGFAYRQHWIELEFTPERIRIETKAGPGRPFRIGFAGEVFEIGAGESRELKVPHRVRSR